MDFGLGYIGVGIGAFVYLRRVFEDLIYEAYGQAKTKEGIKDEDFFKENQEASLLTLEKVYDLEIFASLLVPANEAEIFNPTLWQDDISQLVDYTDNNALYVNEDTIQRVQGKEDVQILALTTCSYEFTDARIVILAIMEASPAE